MHPNNNEVLITIIKILTKQVEELKKIVVDICVNRIAETIKDNK